QKNRQSVELLSAALAISRKRIKTQKPRERSAAMTPTERLLEWHSNWTINQGVVRCRYCNAEQAELDREKTFPHGAGCVKASLGILPWQDLDDVQNAFSSGQAKD
ncbi:hypothetical protein, partial [Pseudomonas umsongensis]|uniref:hypothetical protein n=1 Tax=Pseudomonas umsongensis TaxID=198618 RepID=UPI00200B9A11